MRIAGVSRHRKKLVPLAYIYTCRKENSARFALRYRNCHARKLFKTGQHSTDSGTTPENTSKAWALAFTHKSENPKIPIGPLADPEFAQKKSMKKKRFFGKKNWSPILIYKKRRFL